MTSTYELGGRGDTNIQCAAQWGCVMFSGSETFFFLPEGAYPYLIYPVHDGILNVIGQICGLEESRVLLCARGHLLHTDHLHGVSHHEGVHHGQVSALETDTENDRQKLLLIYVYILIVFPYEREQDSRLWKTSLGEKAQVVQAGGELTEPESSVTQTRPEDLCSRHTLPPAQSTLLFPRVLPLKMSQSSARQRNFKLQSSL